MASVKRRIGGQRTALLAAVLVTAAGLTGLTVLSLGGSEAERTAERFGAAWERGDHRAMYALLTTETRNRTPFDRFTAAYRDAADTATATGIETGEPREKAGSVELPVAVRTRIFGTVTGKVGLPVEGRGVAWTPLLTFPGLPPGTRLDRRTEAPRRAAILARDGTPLVETRGSDRVPMPGGGAEIAGTLAEPANEDERRALFARGFPPGTQVGATGLERIFEDRVAGTPGGVLLGGRRRLASSRRRPAPTVTTTIDTKVEAAAVDALGGRLGGVAALDARTGEVRALAGIAFSGPQPPGSVFKIVTATAALEARLVTPSTRFPVQTATVIEGVRLENASGEACGGTFTASFAHSCNSVFAPLGVRLGAERLVAMAERYGFNAEPPLPGARASTLPEAADLGRPLEVGSTAIGQGRVLATPLQLASMSQTVAADGVRHEPALTAGAAAKQVRVTSPQVARILGRLMVEVVDRGTGRAASLGRGKVAGKTGTAELRTTTGAAGEAGDPTDTDAWFAAYAPAGRPRVAVGILLVEAGAGGATAAPAAKGLLEAALRRRG